LFNSIKKLVAKSFGINDGYQTQWMPVGGGLGSRLESDDYENIYPNVSKIAGSFKEIQPFLVGSDGEPIESEHNVISVLYRPNQNLSDDEFREQLALKWLTQSQYYVRVHYRGNRRVNGTIPHERITGFTFVEGVVPITIDGKKTWRLKDGTQLTESEVMMLGGQNPYDSTGGYSPMDSVKRWTRIEDYMADMQAGHFRNGAVPSGMFIISADSPESFRDIKNMMQRKHRGAKNSNNVMYNWRQSDPNGGTATLDQITWVPFNTTNKDLALKDLQDIIDRKKNRAISVSPVIHGDVDQTTYASAKVVESLYLRYTVKPLARSIWRRFSHELSRITGGFGASISFELEIPPVGDELIQRANARKVDAETIMLLKDSFSVESIVEAFGMDESLLKLTATSAPVPNEAMPQAVEAEEAKEAGSKSASFFSAKARRANENSDELGAIVQEFTLDDFEEVATAYLDRMTMPARNHEADNRLYDILTSNLKNKIASEGKAEFKKALANLDSDVFGGTKPKKYETTEFTKRFYESYLPQVAAGYNEETRNIIRNTIEKGIAKGWSQNRLRKELQKIGLKTYRAERIARTETSRAVNMGTADAYRALSSQMKDHYFVKVWETDGKDPCPICRALHGTETHVDAAYVPHGAGFLDADGHSVENNFVDIVTANAHPNCSCHERYELRRYDGADVTDEEKAAIEGQLASIKLQQGAEPSDHEYKVAQWLVDNYAGNVEFLAPAKENGKKTPDLLYNSMLVDIKKSNGSRSSIDRQIRKGVKQVGAAGLLILDVSGSTVADDAIKGFLLSRSLRVAVGKIIVLRDGAILWESDK